MIKKFFSAVMITSLVVLSPGFECSRALAETMNMGEAPGAAGGVFAVPGTEFSTEQIGGDGGSTIIKNIPTGPDAAEAFLNQGAEEAVAPSDLSVIGRSNGQAVSAEADENTIMHEGTLGQESSRSDGKLPVVGSAARAANQMTSTLKLDGSAQDRDALDQAIDGTGVSVQAAPNTTAGVVVNGVSQISMPEAFQSGTLSTPINVKHVPSPASGGLGFSQGSVKTSLIAAAAGTMVLGAAVFMGYMSWQTAASVALSIGAFIVGSIAGSGEDMASMPNGHGAGLVGLGAAGLAAASAAGYILMHAPPVVSGYLGVQIMFSAGLWLGAAINAALKIKFSSVADELVSSPAPGPATGSQKEPSHVSIGSRITSNKGLAALGIAVYAASVFLPDSAIAWPFLIMAAAVVATLVRIISVKSPRDLATMGVAALGFGTYMATHIQHAYWFPGAFIVYVALGALAGGFFGQLLGRGVSGGFSDSQSRISFWLSLALGLIAAWAGGVVAFLAIFTT